jgi:hypothetical protein
VVCDAATKLRRCRSLEEVEAAYPGLVRTLEFTERRVTWVRQRGGSTPGVVGPLRWLDQVVREHPAMDEPGGQPLRQELRALIGRIRDRA